MIRSARACLVILGSILVACSTTEEGAAVVDSGRSDGGIGIDARADTVIDAAADTAIDTMTTDTRPGPPPDTAAEAPIDAGPIDSGAPEATPPPAPINCLTDDFGPSSATFVDLFYQRQVGPCEASSCSDFVKFDTTCLFTVQVADVEHTATLSAAHCTKLTKWLSSDLLVSYLKDKVTCYGVEPAGKYESTQLTLGAGPVAKKTFMCPDEPFASHRACLDSVRSIYFPGL